MDFHNRQVVWFRVHVYTQRGKKIGMETLIKSLRESKLFWVFFLHFLLDISCIIVYFVSI